MSSIICSRSDNRAVSGNNSVTKMHMGSPPVAAMSLIATFTANQPALSSAPVIGSLLARSNSSAKSNAAVSSPIAGRSTTSFLG